MKRNLFNRRNWMVAGTAMLLGACQIIPKTGPDTTGPVTGPTTEPSATALPTDETRHRIALLVPMSGTNGSVGQSIANATTMALLDTNASNLRITTYDTTQGARSAAEKAVADGNRLILGPLLADNVQQVSSVAAPNNVPLISFSNDTSVASEDVFVMGHIPEQSIERSVAYARQRGSNNFAVLLPSGDYGQRAESALTNALREYGGSLATSENYARGNTSIVSAAQRLRARGGYDTVLIADGARLATQAAGEIKSGDGAGTQILGTELWSGESAVTRAAALRGALFSAVSDNRFRRYRDSYQDRFGGSPHRISTLGYDAVLMTLRVARDWRVGDRFPKRILYSDGGFLGVDGAFRFNRNGVIQRAWEVREVRNGEVSVVANAPTSFSD
ncbi:amino acid/amide ABC transporter substrate-binding protein, HAAT family [Altererythrobacter xiamenensis]|uniref:Amino acid/amide ABC transporter substrate-binding protein, HAAT family n=1 Tax=Altererythrobacter xiamenensis TaxID=1316679 RepID=A0A1Y6FIE9_9SPHN|nr:penicillin-binding protein activator [Altererythrobacter xiamenensis]SMQ74479.1 amino acid/amide ABC transporter substrate-binding protein, HAAT family [Altererythrobacter xiamenensis]